ncbi:hypothetical protein GFK91_16750 [Roseibium aggregatum]|nr:hypothetical protein GFK91_16750 [Roseibium aggregatum]
MAQQKGAESSPLTSCLTAKAQPVADAQTGRQSTRSLTGFEASATGTRRHNAQCRAYSPSTWHPALV